MSDTYWVRYKGRSIGPYTLDKIRLMVRKGQVGRAHEVATDGASWVPAVSFPEIFEPPAAVAAAAPFEPASQTTAPAFAEPAQAQIASGASGPPAEIANWYFAVGGVQQGPMPRSHLLGMIRTGQLAAGDLVFRSGMADWVTAAEAPGLGSALAAPTGASAATSVGVDSFCRACGSGLNKRAVICPKCGAPAGDGLFQQPSVPLVFGEPARAVREGDKKSRTVAAVLALLVGGLGAHHFYLNNVALGIIYLVFCFTFIPALLAFIEAIIFLTMSDDAFDAKYNS